MNALEQRILYLSHKHRRSHIGSALNTVNVLADIYAKRTEGEPVVLGNSHAALALFVVLESVGQGDAEALLMRHGTHATRSLKDGIYVSGGSLGQPETIAVGMALANRTRNVYLVTSDGACAEGAVWEAFRIAHEFKVSNLKTSIVCNGFGAYGPINGTELALRFSGLNNACIHFVKCRKLKGCLEGLAGHYVVLTDEQYEELKHAS